MITPSGSASTARCMFAAPAMAASTSARSCAASRAAAAATCVACARVRTTRTASAIATAVTSAAYRTMCALPHLGDEVVGVARQQVAQAGADDGGVVADAFERATGVARGHGDAHRIGSLEAQHLRHQPVEVDVHRRRRG